MTEHERIKQYLQDGLESRVPAVSAEDQMALESYADAFAHLVLRFGAQEAKAMALAWAKDLQDKDVSVHQVLNELAQLANAARHPS